MNLTRRTFFRTLLGTAAAVACGARLATERVLGSAVEPITLDGFAPTSRLTQAVLERVYNKLIRDTWVPWASEDGSVICRGMIS